jgi:uncharacterized protein with HEPN domain
MIACGCSTSGTRSTRRSAIPLVASGAILDTDEMLLFALVRAIEIAGEAASQITPETRAALPELPWNSMVGMRNRLVHAYFDINRDILWTTVTKAVPQLLEQLKTVAHAGAKRMSGRAAAYGEQL